MTTGLFFTAYPKLDLILDKDGESSVMTQIPVRGYNLLGKSSLYLGTCGCSLFPPPRFRGKSFHRVNI